MTKKEIDESIEYALETEDRMHKMYIINHDYVKAVYTPSLKNKNCVIDEKKSKIERKKEVKKKVKNKKCKVNLF